MPPYFDRDGITIYHGRAEDILPTLPPDSIDLVCTSPPYNLGTTVIREGDRPLGHYRASARGRGRGGAGKWDGAIIADGYGVHADALPHGAYVEWQRAVVQECWRLLSERGAIKIVAGDRRLQATG